MTEKTYKVPGFKKPLSEKSYRILIKRNPDLLKTGFHTSRDDEVAAYVKPEKTVKVKKAKKAKRNPWVDVYNAAYKAGKEAMEACTPTPMVVAQHANPLDDNSAVEKTWYVPSGPCGFAWVNIKCGKGKGRSFINAMKKSGNVSGENDFSNTRFRKDGYYGGYTFYVHEGNQSIELKEAFARAFAKVLNENGVVAYSNSRLD